MLRRRDDPLRRDINERAGKTAFYTFWSTLLPYLLESWLGTIAHLSMLDRGIIFAVAATLFATALSIGGSLISTQIGVKGTASLTAAYAYVDGRPTRSSMKAQE